MVIWVYIGKNHKKFYPFIELESYGYSRERMNAIMSFSGKLEWDLLLCVVDWIHLTSEWMKSPDSCTAGLASLILSVLCVHLCMCMLICMQVHVHLHVLCVSVYAYVCMFPCRCVYLGVYASYICMFVCMSSGLCSFHVLPFQFAISLVVTLSSYFAWWILERTQLLSCACFPLQSSKDVCL